MKAERERKEAIVRQSIQGRIISDIEQYGTNASEHRTRKVIAPQVHFVVLYIRPWGERALQRYTMKMGRKLKTLHHHAARSCKRLW